MSIEDIIHRRNIREVLHFTTNKGLIGIFDSRALKSRERLTRDQRLEFILKINTPPKDPGWSDYVNLSISRINLSLFGHSGRWHPDVRWRILSFDPIVLTHEGVYFATTNNIYPSVRRQQGPDGLEALFAEVVFGRYSTRIERTNELLACYPTCEQAEVLYPGELSTDFLRAIYVETDEDQDDVCAQISALGHSEPEVIVNSQVFRT